MKTKHKIFLAKATYRVIHAARACVGKSDQCRVTRSGALFDLDLSQGIDFAIFLLGAFEPRTSRVLRRLIKPGHTVIDVGANIGAHTLTMAQGVGETGRVVACEPTDFAFAKLQRNLALNPMLQAHVTALQCFLGPGPGAHQEVPLSIYSRWPLTGGSDLHEKHFGAKEGTTGANASSLDEVVRSQQMSRVDLVKIDVDGFECDILAGAQEVLATQRPIFIMELAPYVLGERGFSLEMILDVFRDKNYELFDETLRTRLPLAPKQLENMIGPDAGINVVARHAHAI